jgi:hypothetical protein
MGYVTRDGGLLKTNAEFKAGKLLINGKPFMPRAEPAAMENEPQSAESDPSLFEENTAPLDTDSAQQ